LTIYYFFIKLQALAHKNTEELLMKSHYGKIKILTGTSHPELVKRVVQELNKHESADLCLSDEITSRKIYV